MLSFQNTVLGGLIMDKRNIEVLCNAARSLVYCLEQTAVGTDQWRINQNVYSIADSLCRYLTQNVDRSEPDAANFEEYLIEIRFKK